MARTTTVDFDQMSRPIETALAHPGFAVVENLSQCPTYFGRLNKLGAARALLDYEGDMTQPLEGVTREDLVGKLPIVVFRQGTCPEYTRRYAALCERARRGAHS